MVALWGCVVRLRCAVPAALDGASLSCHKQTAHYSARAMVLTAEQHRANRARKNYGRNAGGKLVRKKAFRDCDYTPDGHLRQFDDDAGFAAFEEERHRNG